MSDLHSILPHVPVALLVIFRIGGLMITGPVFGSPVIPVRVKVALAFLIGFAVYPLLARDVLSGAAPELELWSLGPLVAMELVIGLVIGFAATVPLVAVQTGGLMMGQQMGLGFARFYNPGIDDEADVIGQMLFFMTLAAFLAIGGHEAMVLAILHSFEHIPLGAFSVRLDLVSFLTGLLLSAFELALRVAAPVLALVFLQSVAMGFMAKTVPQLNILSLGFPLRILLGTTMILLGLVVMHDVVMEEIDFVLDQVFSWIESTNPGGDGGG